jgi:hypothetical protein
LKVEGSGLGIKGLGSRVYTEFRVKSLRFRV